MATQIMQSYTPYGHTSAHSTTPLILFNGEALICPLYVYSLGMGIRSYSPALMRFFSADRLSPFGKGGINTYNYCSGDPVNFQDPSGQIRQLPRKMRREMVNLGPDNDYTKVSRRPVKRKAYDTSNFSLKTLFDQYPIGKIIAKHLDHRENSIIGKMFPEFSAHNTLQLAQSIKNPKIMHPLIDTTDLVVLIHSYSLTTKQDAISMLERKATATRAGYVYGKNQVAISLSRIRSRVRNDSASPTTDILWQ